MSERNWLKEQRQRAGMTQEAMCRWLGEHGIEIDRPTYSRIENGSYMGILDAIEHLCTAQNRPQNGENVKVDKCIDAKQIAAEIADFSVKSKIREILEAAKLPVTRLQLCAATGTGDRRVREAISMLRDDGLPILSTSHGRGYWLATTMEEYDAFEREYLSRAYKQIGTAKKMREGMRERIEVGSC